MDAKSAGDWYVRVAEAVRGELIKVFQAALPRPKIDQEKEDAWADAQQKQRDKEEKEAQEKAEREAKEQEEQEAQEKAEREAAEKAEKEDAERQQKEEEDRTRNEGNEGIVLDIKGMVEHLLKEYPDDKEADQIDGDRSLATLLIKFHNGKIGREELEEQVEGWYKKSKSGLKNELKAKFEKKTVSTLRYTPNTMAVSESAFTEFDRAALERLNIVCTPWLAEREAKIQAGEVRLSVAGTVTPAVKTLIGDTIGQWIKQGKTDCKVDDVNVQVRAYDESGLTAVGDGAKVEPDDEDANALAK
ncbi:hypothetical protein WM23_00025 [Burkholderia ubonensis]|nr:hypothetical protein WM23_00025 [Burkholderia ubonensis]